MRKTLAYILIAFLAAAIFLSPEDAELIASEKGKSKKTKEISITFDHLPVDSSFKQVDRVAVTNQILEALKKHEIKAAGFVVGQNIGGDYDLLGNWLNQGHVLGNMTFSHQDLHEIGIENYIKEIMSGGEVLETMLAGFGQKKRYFRHPFLHYGNTMEAKREVQLYLDNKAVKVAHTTVTVEDYLYNLSLEKLGDEPDSADIDLIGIQYLEHVMEQVEAAEKLSTMVLHRQCRHILPLRASELNALVLDELLQALSDNGYKFISLDRALADKLYEAEEAYFGTRGVGYIEMISQSDPDYLPAQ